MSDTEFVTAFTEQARQLAGPDFAAQWVALAEKREDDNPLTAQEAAGWANLGYTPSEAAAEMARGISLQDAQYIEDERTRRPYAAHIWRDGKRLV